MTKRIVDRFETVEIDKHECQTGTFARGVRDPLFEAVVDQHAIRQAGERVARCQEFDTFFRESAFADVGHRSGHAQRAACRVALGDFAFRMQPHPFFGLAGCPKLALKIIRRSLGRRKQRSPNAGSIIGMIPRQDFFAGVHECIAFNPARTEQGTPVLAEKNLVTDQIPVPNGESRTDERKVEALLGPRYLALGLLPLGDVAADADTVALPVDIQRLAVK